MKNIKKATLSMNRVGCLVEGPHVQGAIQLLSYYDKDCKFFIYKLTQPWKENNAQWDKLNKAHDPQPLDTFDFKKGFKGWIDFNVTSAIKEFIKNPDKNFGFIVQNHLKLPDNQSGNMSEFWTSEAKDVTMRPKLTIEQDPTKIIHNTNIAPTLIKASITSTHDYIQIDISGQPIHSISVYTPLGKDITSKISHKVNTNMLYISKKYCQSKVIILHIRNAYGTKAMKLHISQ